MVTLGRSVWLRRSLKMLQAILAGGSIWMLVLAFGASPPGLFEKGVATSAGTEPIVLEEKLPALSWYAPLWQRNMRQELFPTESTPLQATPTPPQPLPTLQGTFVEQDRRFAHVRTHAGILRVHTVGDEVDGYRIAKIDHGRVRLVRDDREFTIEVERLKPRLAVRTSRGGS